MSAAQRPQTDESPASADAEGWALLDGLRRRLDEQANQSRKTQTEVRQLADSIAAMVEQQRKRSRWLNVNSFVAYVMFTLLCGGAFYFVFESRAHELVAERERIKTERDTAVHRADEALKKTAAESQAGVIAQLTQAGTKFQAFWATNAIRVSGGSAATVQALAGRAEVEITDLAPSGRVCTDNPLLRHLRATSGLQAQSKQAWTDVARLGALGVDAVNLGPGETAQAHQAGESAGIPAMARVYEALAAFLQTAPR